MGTANDRYTDWLRKLREWLDIPDAAFGSLVLELSETKQGTAPIKARGMVRLNRAQKCECWLQEICCLGAKEETAPRRSRIQQLWEAVVRIDWPEACPMRNPSMSPWGRMHEEARQARKEWRNHHRTIAADNRSRLSKWQMNIRDSVANGGGKEVRRWPHPPRRPAVFQSEGKLITHPAEIVGHLREAWEPIMTQEPGKERMLLLRGMPKGR